MTNNPIFILVTKEELLELARLVVADCEFIYTCETVVEKFWKRKMGD